jgi:hypothetical protein
MFAHRNASLGPQRKKIGHIQPFSPKVSGNLTESPKGALDPLPISTGRNIAPAAIRPQGTIENHAEQDLFPVPCRAIQALQINGPLFGHCFSSLPRFILAPDFFNVDS